MISGLNSMSSFKISRLNGAAEGTSVKMCQSSYAHARDQKSAHGDCRSVLTLPVGQPLPQVRHEHISSIVVARYLCSCLLSGLYEEVELQKEGMEHGQASHCRPGSLRTIIRAHLGNYGCNLITRI